MRKETIAASLLGLLPCLLASSAFAANLLVAPSQDKEASDSGDGECSLREALQAANNDSSIDACTAGEGADRIELQPGEYVLSTTGTESDDASATISILPKPSRSSRPAKILRTPGYAPAADSTIARSTFMATATSRR